MTRDRWDERLEALDIVPRGKPTPLGGGTAASLWQLDSAQGRLVLKQDEPERLAAEAEGLKALRAAGSLLIVPEVLGQQAGLLVMEALAPARGGHDAERALGEGLRQLHTATGAAHGWERDNFCGPTPQHNAPLDDGRDFQRQRRLLALGHACSERGLLDKTTLATLTEVAEALETWLPDTPPCLVHGDLWSGNVLYTAQGPALIDPAVYRHYPEVDLAMLTLFGAPSPAFFEAYWEGNAPDDWLRRQALFQLYPLLNHLLLFGAGYRGAVERTLDKLR